MATVDLPLRPAAAPTGPPDQGPPLCLHSFHWGCPFWLGKMIWILLKRYFRKGRWGLLGLLIKSGPRWCCCWRANWFSVLINQQLCRRPGLCLCFRLIWVLKWLLLGSWVAQSPTSADICCSVVRRCLTASAYLGTQANVQWSWKEKHSQGHCALSSSCCGCKGVC